MFVDRTSSSLIKDPNFDMLRTIKFIICDLNPPYVTVTYIDHSYINEQGIMTDIYLITLHIVFNRGKMSILFIS